MTPGVPRLGRRDVLCSAAALLPTKAAWSATQVPQFWRHLPRWRGFNLLEKFQDKPDALSEIAPEWSFHNAPFRERDFQMIAGWGFDFVRLPMSYRCWIRNGDPESFDERTLREIDDAVSWGIRYGVHVCINFHRAPGYCINPPPEPRSLWTDPEAQRLCALHWSHFAQRYRGVSPRSLSFDLLNEPYGPTDAQYARVVALLCAAIRRHDPDRLIIADGNGAGYKPVPSLAGERVAQSTRGYVPKELTHFQAPWVEAAIREIKRVPDWPFHSAGGDVWDRARLRQMYAPWRALDASGIGVMMGEFGVYKYTPHTVALAFLDDLLATMREAGWGWALWGLRGPMGILNSGRADITYEPLGPDRLDRAMLDLLVRN